MRPLRLCAAALIWTAVTQPGAARGADWIRIGQTGGTSTKVTLVSHTPDPPGFLRRWELWCEELRECVRETRLRGYKRMQRMHRRLLYPECPPQCSPTYGYFHTTWRPFPADQLPWADAPAHIILPDQAPMLPQPAPHAPTAPAAPPAVPDNTPQPAPPATEPYFPEVRPLIEPAQPAPESPTEPPEPPEPPADPAVEVPPVDAAQAEIWLPPIVRDRVPKEDRAALVWLE